MRTLPLILAGAFGFVAFDRGSAVSLATFTGGPRDGGARADCIVPQPTPAILHYPGGARDGYASSVRLAYQAAAFPGAVRYFGNLRDGYSSSLWRGWGSTAVPAQLRFAGSLHDGYISARFLYSGSSNRPARFFGGGGGGYDRRAVFGLPNWTIGDTDGNGLPDWWELKFFGVLAGTPRDGDADQDGASNFAEYIAGTDPTNPGSRFRIVSLALGSPARIVVTCESNHLYSLFSSDAPGTNWAPVANQIRIPSSPGGTLELEDSPTTPTRYYRVRIEQ